MAQWGIGHDRQARAVQAGESHSQHGPYRTKPTMRGIGNPGSRDV